MADQLDERDDRQSGRLVAQRVKNVENPGAKPRREVVFARDQRRISPGKTAVSWRQIEASPSIA